MTDPTAKCILCGARAGSIWHTNPNNSQYHVMVTPSDDDFEDTCYSTGHDTEVIYEDDTGYDWRCIRCGAEGWEDTDE